MFKELTALAPFTMKFLWLLHESESTQFRFEDPLALPQHFLAVLFFFGRVGVSHRVPNEIVFHRSTLSSSARLHDHLNTIRDLGRVFRVREQLVFFLQFHGHENIQFFDIHCGIFFCVHFTVGYNNRPETFRVFYGFQLGRVKGLS